MAPAKQSDAVVHKVLPNGDHAIGVELDGGFVPFAQLDAAYAKSLAEAAKSPEAVEAAGEAEEESE